VNSCARTVLQKERLPRSGRCSAAARASSKKTHRTPSCNWHGPRNRSERRLPTIKTDRESSASGTP